MPEFIAQAQRIAREEGLTFREACSVLGKRSGARRIARARQKSRKANWRARRWDLDYENLN